MEGAPGPGRSLAARRPMGTPGARTVTEAIIFMEAIEPNTAAEKTVFHALYRTGYFSDRFFGTHGGGTGRRESTRYRQEAVNRQKGGKNNPAKEAAIGLSGL